MFLVAIVLISALAVPLFGGRLSALADIRARLAWILMLALGLQVVALTVPGVPESQRPLIQLASYPIAGMFVIANRHLPGMLLIGLGALLNLIAMSANGGVMPASAAALDKAGLPLQRDTYANSALVRDPRLGFLGDVFAVPEPVPLHNVFSVGDVTIGVVTSAPRVAATPPADGVLRRDAPQAQATLGPRQGQREVGHRPGKRAGGGVVVAVALRDVDGPLVQGHRLAGRADGHVAVGERVGDRRRLPRKAFQLAVQAAQPHLEAGLGMVGDQSRQPLVPERAQVPCAVQGMAAGLLEGGRVADVVEVGGGDELDAVPLGERAGHPEGPLPDGPGMRPVVSERSEQLGRVLGRPCDQCVTGSRGRTLPEIAPSSA